MEEQRDRFLQSISSIEVVPLDLDSVLLNPYSQMRVTADRICIFNRQTHELSIFSSTGEKTAVISNFGDALGHYINVNSFALLSDSIIAMYDNAKGNVLFFDEKGEFIKEQNMRHVAANCMACINDSLFVMYTKTLTLFDSNKDIFRFVSEDGKVKSTSSTLPRWISKSSLVPRTWNSFSYYDRDVLWSEQWERYIYSFSSDSVYCKYAIGFGEQNVPESFYIEHLSDFEKDKVIEMMNDIGDNGWATNIELVQENQNYVYFEYQYKGAVYYALWDKNTEVCNTVRLADMNIWIPLLSGGFLCSYQNNFYSLINVKNLNKVYLEHKDTLTEEPFHSFIRQFEEYQAKVHLEDDDYILLAIKMK